MELPDRKPTRLSGFDYSTPNYYFVTICVHNKLHLFGEVDNINEYGKIAEIELLSIPNHFDSVRIDKYVIMPNHIHAIIIIGCDGLDTERSRPFPTLSTIIGLYKSGVSKRIHEIEPNIQIWQKSFNDRIICNDKGYQEVWQYIDENPMKCEKE